METDTLKARFQTKYTIEGDCWIWHAYVDNKVPMFPVKRRYRSARQMALQIYTGASVPAGYVARASCGNSLCVNPNHAEIVPRSQAFGARVRAKLTNQNVHEIRTLLAQGNLTHAEIAQRFHVVRSTITHIATGRNWRQDTNPYRRPDKRAAFEAVLAIARAADDLKDPDVRYRIRRACRKTYRLTPQHADAVAMKALRAVQAEREEQAK